MPRGVRRSNARIVEAFEVLLDHVLDRDPALDDDTAAERVFEWLVADLGVRPSVVRDAMNERVRLRGGPNPPDAIDATRVRP